LGQSVLPRLSQNIVLAAKENPSIPIEQVLTDVTAGLSSVIETNFNVQQFVRHFFFFFSSSSFLFLFLSFRLIRCDRSWMKRDSASLMLSVRLL
jgi:hypothetical protein